MVGFLVLVVLAGCGGGAKTLPTATTTKTLTVSSSAFKPGAAIPVGYSCDGTVDTPPQLSWSGVPDGTKSLAVVIQDPDADGFVHWLVDRIPAGTTQLNGTLPAGAHQDVNGYGRDGWAPLCPPKGKGTHHYTFAVYALDGTFDPGADDLIGQMQMHALASGTLTGTFKR